ncbi:MAG: putative membrane-anchored protein [Candidatus Poriferisodalaceae bacterium]|jgi:uncharacterized membrane-anchored protein
MFRRRHQPDSSVDLDADGVAGRALSDRRTKNLIPRLERGDIAVINHEDLDRVAAEGLVVAGAAAVVNSANSITGRYPALGALIVAKAGIPLLDQVGEATFNRINNGDLVVVVGDEVRVGGVKVGNGRRRNVAELEIEIEDARESASHQLEAFASNTLAYLAREPDLVNIDPIIPETGIDFAGRQVLVVVRGIDYREDLEALRRSGYMHEMRPVFVGVDGGADALLELGLTPDLILGDFDSVSTEALRSGAQLLVHAYPGGEAPGTRRLDRLEFDYQIVEARGTSEDLALLMAFEERAELIVVVGSHTSMNDFLDKDREGMASTFLTRMKVAPILVDAKGVSRLYRTQVRKRDLGLLILSALFTIIVIAVVTEPVRLLLRTLWINLN